MAGMFYSLQEVAEKLNVTEKQAKELIKGKLREFRDGPNLLYKIDEVEALMSDTSITASEAIAPGPEQGTGEHEISLAPETIEDTAAASELTDADTAIAREEITVPAETDVEQELPDDTVIEAKGTTGEVSLEEIEEDVNLDTFGSGSGLLDLSLQADDTSLGGILDEIYAPEGGEGEGAAEASSAMEVAAEAEQMLPEEMLAGPQLAAEVPALAQAYIEPEPDVLSNTFGIMLLLPLLAIVYTAIVVVADFNDVMPTILEKIQGIIWYIMIGAVVVVIVIVGMAFMLSDKGSKPFQFPHRIQIGIFPQGLTIRQNLSFREFTICK